MALGLSVTDLVSAPDQYLHAKTKDLNLETKLLVGSDGNKSKVKELSHIGTYGWSYNQMGIVCTVQSTTQSSTAYQRFLNNGYHFLSHI
jgi:2-polyprenyl-6-methoxyphenol hydroxylase-like FAD-dependent oxidoreductase